MRASQDRKGRAGSALATIRDVAARAGVSVSTASKALSDKDEVAPLTRQRVRQAAEELHFTPNALIRSLQRGRTGTIGVLAWPVRADTAQDITMPLLKGISDGIAATGRDLLLYSEPAISGRPVTVSLFLDGRVDGVVLGPGVLPSESLEALAASGLPSVLVYRDAAPGSMGSVTIDNAAGIRAALAHLAGLGHRRIACFMPQSSFDLRQRYAAYRQGMEDHGFPIDPSLCFLPEGWSDGLREAAGTLLEMSDPPTALIAGDDGLALALMGLLTARGVRVPDDLSIVGFDDCPAAGAAPGLTTIRQPAYDVGRAAGLFVDRLIGGAPAEECRALLPVTLVARGTTAPARASTAAFPH